MAFYSCIWVYIVEALSQLQTWKSLKCVPLIIISFFCDNNVHGGSCCSLTASSLMSILIHLFTNSPESDITALQIYLVFLLWLLIKCWNKILNRYQCSCDSFLNYFKVNFTFWSLTRTPLDRPGTPISFCLESSGI